MNDLQLLGLTARTRMVLERNGVSNIQQLCSMESWHVLRFPGLGRISYKEIATSMSAHGFRFVDSTPKPQADSLSGNSGILSISVRDYFAAKALQALITQGCYCYEEGETPEAHARSTFAARDAYRFADAMLAARVKP